MPPLGPGFIIHKYQKGINSELVQKSCQSSTSEAEKSHPPPCSDERAFHSGTTHSLPPQTDPPVCHPKLRLLCVVAPSENIS